MSKPFDAEKHVDQMSTVAGLTIETEWRASVVDNMAATAAVAALVMSFPLDDHIEPAPVFEA